jgi:hypothetical protein
MNTEHYCPKCGQAWVVHDGDGGCVQDEEEWDTGLFCGVIPDSLPEQWEDISIYTRAQAIEDGVLVDLSKRYPNDTRLYKYPVACTSAVWAIIENAVEKYGGNAGAWVWDLCWMSVHAKVWIFSEREHQFGCIIGRKQRIFKVNCGPGDDLEPVITIMMPDED